MTSNAATLSSKTCSERTVSESIFALKDAHFYQQYDWSLNVYPMAADSLHRLRSELIRCTTASEGWRRSEVLTNIFLHCCAIADTTDDYLFGAAYDLSQVARIPFSSPAIRAVNAALELSRRIRSRLLARLLAWRRQWDAAVLEFLRTSLLSETVPSAHLIQRLHALSQQKLPSKLLHEVAKVPAAFRSHDTSHHDIFALGKRFLATIDDRQRPILVIGLRTAGSYFAPLLAAYLQAHGCPDVDCVSLRPKKGIAPWERAKLAANSTKQGRAVVIDEPINTGKTLLKSLNLLHSLGIRDSLSIVVPVHASRPDWNDGYKAQGFSRLHVVPLEPEHWYKCSVLEPGSVAKLMREWLVGDEKSDVIVRSDDLSDQANQKLEASSEKKFHSRLKRVYRIDCRNECGNTTTRYVLAKGVGWGWYGYHAVLAAQHLRRFVPPLIGFRDGILFQQWLGEQESLVDHDHQHFVRRAAEYVAERTRFLKLDRNPVSALAFDNRHKATDELSGVLGKAYGSRPAAFLRRTFLRQNLLMESCAAPTFIDGKMHPQEWVKCDGRLVKTDFEHHGLGKTELNAMDPGYDLADAILQWHLSDAEENELLSQYILRSGDTRVTERLQLNKMLAGVWSMMRAADNLNDPRLACNREKFNRAYIDAWTFLVIHTTRFAGELCTPKPKPGWKQRLLVMDIDGVLDRLAFGFPTTTAAGIRAISLLHAHDWPIAINTARSIAEVKEYCAAYRMVGGVAEYGAYIWDAVSGKERVLVSPESLRQLETLANELRRIPGVFLNDNYQYSLRAFTYQNGVCTALPTLIIQNLISQLRLDRLRLHQTFLDSTVVATETDKGRGLLALLALAGQRSDNVVAIGDTEPDLPMFSVVKRGYAPAHIQCKHAARLLGCRIVKHPYQRGLLEAAHQIVHETPTRCIKCDENERLLAGSHDLLVQMLQVADQGKISSLFRALLSPNGLSSLRQ